MDTVNAESDLRIFLPFFTAFSKEQLHFCIKYVLLNVDHGKYGYHKLYMKSWKGSGEMGNAKTLNLSKEQARETPMVDLAFRILKQANTPFYYKDIMAEIAKIKEIPDDQIMDVIAQLYTEINIDGRFACVGANLWGLKRWYPLNKGEDGIGSSERPVIINDDDDDEDLEDDDIFEEELFSKKKKKKKKAIDDDPEEAKDDFDDNDEDDEDDDSYDDDDDLDEDDEDQDLDEDDLDDDLDTDDLDPDEDGEDDPDEENDK